MRVLIAAASVGLILVQAEVVLAEPLTPPPGPVAGTGVTQILQFPAAITEPGSYRLGRDLALTVATNGITIDASNVTLDLGGHVLDGAGIGGEAIILLGETENVTIQNGVILNWEGSAIYDSIGVDRAVVVRNVRMSNLGFEAIRLANTDATVIDCVVSNTNGSGPMGQGIWVGPNSRVINCTVTDVGGEGILTGANSFISGCIVTGATTMFGAAGIAAGNQAIIENCIAERNHRGGFTVGQGALLKNCTATNNASPTAASASMPIDHRTGEVVPLFEPAAPMINARTKQPIQDRVAAMLTTEGVGVAHGFLVASDSRIVDCVSVEHSGSGFVLSHQSTVTGCVASLNSGNGIDVTGDNMVKNNRATTNTNGIVLGVDGNHCEDNYVSTNANAGILVNDEFAVVVRNHFEMNVLSNPGGSILLGPHNDMSNPWTNWFE